MTNTSDPCIRANLRQLGISMRVSRQRPAEKFPSVLPQCGAWAVFRLTSEEGLLALSVAGQWFDR